MPTIQENISLLPYNTFKIDAKARYFTELTSGSEMQTLVTQPIFQQPRLILGGGSNILLTRDFDGLVIRNDIRGIDIVHETDDEITLKVGSGENWHALVLYAVERNYGGIENLSLIPGTVGAAPMQNIGAYGVEVKDVINEVEAVNLESGAVEKFDNAACHFGYRESFFKQEGKNRYFISSITLSLTRKNHHYNTTYGAIKDTLSKMGVTELSIRAVSDAVIDIRKSKLPDPAITGNAGSFFKNPTIALGAYEMLRERYPAIPGYPDGEKKIKIPAGWLIEQSGLKGKTFGRIGVHPLQALVIVNYGGGTGEEIWNLSMKIREVVKEKFGIEIQPEVNIV